MNKVINKYFDIIVIGAGPAGSVAARFAAEAGCSVLILERDREPGIPVRCGEGVSHNGIVQFIDIDSKWICTKIEGARFHSPDGNYLDMYYHGLGSIGYVLERRLFDRALADLAVKKGAILLTKADAIDLIKTNEIINGVIFKYRKDLIKVECKVVIGADGIESKVGRWAGMNTCLSLEDVSTLCQYTINNSSFDTKICHFYLGQDVCPSGYIWVFPKTDSVANVGAGMSGDRIRRGFGPRYYLDKFINKHFPNASINYEVYGGIPGRANSDFVKDNVMLVGDAAHQADPITGGGIVQSMIGGKYCGETAAKMILANDISIGKEYNQKWEYHLGKSQRFLYQLKNKLLKYEDKKFNTIMNVCKKIPQHELSLSRIFRESIKDDPILVAKLATDYIISKMKS